MLQPISNWTWELCHNLNTQLILADSFKQKYLVTYEILKTKLNLLEASEYGQDEALVRLYSSMRLRWLAGLKTDDWTPLMLTATKLTNLKLVKIWGFHYGLRVDIFSTSIERWRHELAGGLAPVRARVLVYLSSSNLAWLSISARMRMILLAAARAGNIRG